MSPRETTWTVSTNALKDLNDITGYYVDQMAWQAAIDIPERIVDSFAVITAHPRAVPIGESGFRERILPDIPFRICYDYDPAAKRITILNIVHTRRHWPAQ